MSQLGYAQPQANTEQQREMNVLMDAFIEQNERLYSMISALESTGHRLKDTNYPKELDVKGMSPVAPQSGWMYDLGEQADRFRISNNRLNEFIDKLNSII